MIVAAQRIISEFRGEVPSDYDTLLSFEGVHHKIATIMMQEVYGYPCFAPAVDVHGIRVTYSCGMMLKKKSTKRKKLSKKRENLGNNDGLDVLACLKTWLHPNLFL